MDAHKRAVSLVKDPEKALVEPGKLGTWTGEQREILDVINTVARLQQEGAIEDTLEYIHPNLTSWDMAKSRPMDRVGFERMLRGFFNRWKFVRSELIPVDVHVDDDVAVAHFRYNDSFLSVDGKQATSAGCWNTTLVKRKGSWLFLCWDWIENRS